MIKLSSLLFSLPPSRAAPVPSQVRPRRLPRRFRRPSLPRYRGSAGHARLPCLPAVSLLPVRVPNFSWLFCFQGAASPRRRHDRALSRFPAPGTFLHFGFSFFLLTPLRERRRLLYQIHGFCQGVFSKYFANILPLNTEDISETFNLSDVCPEIRDRMYKKLCDWKQMVNTKIPAPNPNWK